MRLVYLSRIFEQLKSNRYDVVTGKSCHYNLIDSNSSAIRCRDFVQFRVVLVLYQFQGLYYRY
jgi:hypothetical protein